MMRQSEPTDISE